MKKILLFALGGVMVYLSGCYPGEALTTSELDIIYTEKSESADFTNYLTYTMPDTIAIYKPEDDDFDLTPSEQAGIIQRIKDNMDDLGYDFVDPNDATAEVDLIVFPEILIANHSQVGSCWTCWGGWYPWWPGWGWYPPYPPSYVVRFQSGTILMNIIDVDSEPSDDDQIETEWTAAINGLMRSGLSDSQIYGYIDQAFTQSPYLDINN